MYRKRYLDYSDCFVSIFNSDDKCKLVFVNDKGDTMAVDYDSNFFYVEYLLDTYYSMIIKSLKSNYYKINGTNDEIKPYLRKYYRHIKRQCSDIDLSLASEQVNALLQ